MSWDKLEPPAKPQQHRAALVYMAMSAGKGRISRKMSISFRSEMAAGVPFLKTDQFVSILLGRDHDAGKLRVVPGESFRLVMPGGVAPSKVLVLRFPAPAGAAALQRKPEAVTFRIHENVVEIDLPDWARSSPPPPPPLQVAAAAPAPAPIAAPVPRRSGEAHLSGMGASKASGSPIPWERGR